MLCQPKSPELPSAEATWLRARRAAGLPVASARLRGVGGTRDVRGAVHRLDKPPRERGGAPAAEDAGSLAAAFRRATTLARRPTSRAVAAPAVPASASDY